MQATNLQRVSSTDLGCIPFFDTFEEESLHRLAEKAVRRSYPLDSRVISAGTNPLIVQVVLSGMAMSYSITLSGKVVCHNIYKSGSILALEVLLRSQNEFLRSVKTISDMEVLEWRWNDFKTAIDRYPNALYKIAVVVAENGRLEQESTRNILELNAVGRVLSTLCVLRKHMGDDLPFTHQQIGDMSFTSRETTSRVLEQLRERQLIDYSQDSNYHRRIKILFEDENLQEHLSPPLPNNVDLNIFNYT